MPIRWRYVVEGEVPDQLVGAQLEGMIRSSVSITDTLLPFLRGSKVEFATQDGAPIPGEPRPVIERVK